MSFCVSQGEQGTPGEPGDRGIRVFLQCFPRLKAEIYQKLSIIQSCFCLICYFYVAFLFLLISNFQFQDSYAEGCHFICLVNTKMYKLHSLPRLLLSKHHFAEIIHTFSHSSMSFYVFMFILIIYCVIT